MQSKKDARETFVSAADDVQRGCQEVVDLFIQLTRSLLESVQGLDKSVGKIGLV